MILFILSSAAIICSIVINRFIRSNYSINGIYAKPGQYFVLKFVLFYILLTIRKVWRVNQNMLIQIKNFYPIRSIISLGRYDLSNKLMFLKTKMGIVKHRNRKDIKKWSCLSPFPQVRKHLMPYFSVALVLRGLTWSSLRRGGQTILLTLFSMLWYSFFTF